MELRGVFFVLICGWLANSWAIPYKYQKDIADEIQSADFLSATSDQKKVWIDQLNNSDLDLTVVRQIVNMAKVGTMNPLSANSNVQSLTILKTEKPDLKLYTPILGKEVGLESRHAISNLPGYIQSRIGNELFTLLKNQKQKTIVLGSEPNLLNEDIKNILPKGRYEITPIPSIYEKWGLYRYWIDSKTSSDSFFIILVPPSIQYVRHYVSVLDSAAVFSSSKGFLNRKAQATLKNKLQADVAKVQKDFGNVDVLFFGYEKNWTASLKKDSAPFKILNSKTISTSNDLDLHLMELQNRKNSKIIRLGSLRPQQTVWGELASFYFEELLELKPQIIIFLGSAGSLVPHLKPYQVSVPDEFMTPEGKIKVSNWILSEKTTALSSDIFKTARHGHTYSPIQQGKSYVKALVEAHIETVDVEQALVARMIEEFNTENKTAIKFGAINIITDQPGGILLPKHLTHANLDNLDLKAKNFAKDKAVQIALGALDKWAEKLSVKLSVAQGSCKVFFK
jgi:hypothetical protein